MMPVPVGAGPHHDAASAMAPLNVVVKRPALAQRDPNHLALGLFRGLANGFGHFLGLALAKPHATLLVADDDECGKAEALAALHGLRHTVDRDEAVAEFRRFVAVAAPAVSWFPGHTAFSPHLCAEALLPDLGAACGPGHRGGVPPAVQIFSPASRAASARALTLP